MPALLRCKFYVSEITKTVGQCRKLKLTPVTSDSADNKSWSKFTPSGSFEITITNESLFEKIDALVPGDVYFIDLSSPHA